MPREGVNEVRDYLGSPSRAGGVNERLDREPKRVWHADAGRGTVASPALGERVTIIATVDRWVTALDTRTGKLFWRYRGDAPFGASPLIGAGHIFAATTGPEGKVISIRLETGKKRWTQKVGDVIEPLVYHDSVVYASTQTGAVFAFRASDGRRLWAKRVGPMLAGALVVGDRVIVLTNQDSLVVLDARNGQIKSRVGSPVSPVAPFAVLSDSTIVAISPSGEVVGISVPSGVARWRVRTGDVVFGSPVVAGDTVFALTNRCTLWTLAPGGVAPDTAAIGCNTVAAPRVVRGGVLVSSIAGDIIYFDRATRRVAWTRPAGGELRQPPAVLDGQIVAAPILGDVVSFR